MDSAKPSSPSSSSSAIPRERYEKALDLLTQKDTEIDRMKTEFLSVASHQFRTPLTSMNWYLELVLDEANKDLSDRDREYLEEVYVTSRRMVGMVNDLLNASRLETGTLRATPEAVDIVAFLKSLIKEVQPLARQHEAELTFSSSVESGEIQADPALLHHMFSNLLTNGIKYSSFGERSGQVTLDCAWNEEERVVDVSVRDNGIGIPNEAQKDLFTKFFRADNAIQMVTDGSGLGLYIVSMAVAASGGTIRYETEEERGTLFVIRLPFSAPTSKTT